MSLSVTSGFTPVPLHQTGLLDAKITQRSWFVDCLFHQKIAEMLILLDVEMFLSWCLMGFFKQKDTVSQWSLYSDFPMLTFSWVNLIWWFKSDQNEIMMKYTSMSCFCPQVVPTKWKVCSSLLILLYRISLSFRTLKKMREYHFYIWKESIRPEIQSFLVQKNNGYKCDPNFFCSSSFVVKNAALRGVVHTLFKSCSSWDVFDKDLRKTQGIFKAIQYPPSSKRS